MYGDKDPRAGGRRTNYVSALEASYTWYADRTNTELSYVLFPQSGCPQHSQLEVYQACCILASERIVVFSNLILVNSP